MRSLGFELNDLLRPWTAIAIAVALAAGLGWLWTRARAGRARLGAIGVNIGFAAALAAITATQGAGGALVAAALYDVATEARARARGAWSVIAEVHDVDAADLLLADDGAARCARGLHMHALLRGLAPMVPIEILEAQSPEQQALEAGLPAARVVTTA